MQKNEKQNRYTTTTPRTTGTNSWFTGKAVSEEMTLGNLSRTPTTPWNSYRNTGTPTNWQNRRPRSPPTTFKLPGNLWKVPPHHAQQTIVQTTSGNLMTMRNIIPAALSRTISPQMTTASYGTPTDESAEYSEDFGMMVDFSEYRSLTCVHVLVTVHRSGQCRISYVYLIYI